MGVSVTLSPATKAKVYWLLRPISIIFALAWLFHPATSLKYHIDTMMLWGFLIGCTVALLWVMNKINHHYIQIKQGITTESERFSGAIVLGDVKEEIIFEDASDVVKAHFNEDVNAEADPEEKAEIREEIKGDIKDSL